jgi:lysozyme
MTNPTPSKSGKFGIIGGTAAAAILAAAAFIKPWEGTIPKAYYDVVGVLTICVGHTGSDVYEGQVVTQARCDALLASDIGKTYTQLAGCVHREVTQNQAVSLLSLGFNIGGRAICQSTLVRQLNEGQPASIWCKQILRWDRAGGRQIKGLTRRREAEYRVCIS